MMMMRYLEGISDRMYMNIKSKFIKYTKQILLQEKHAVGDHNPSNLNLIKNMYNFL